MNNSVVSRDHKEGLVIGCFDLFESYGNDLLEALELIKPQDSYNTFHASIGPRNLGEKDLEELKKQEELRLKKEEEEKQKKKDKLASLQKKGREKASYTALKQLRILDTKCFKNKSIAKKLCQREGIIVNILKTIREKVKENPNANIVFSTMSNSALLVPTFSEMLVEFMKNKGLESKDVYVYIHTNDIS